LPLPDNIAGLEGRAEAKNLLTIIAALQNISLEQAVTNHAGQSFSTFKQQLTDVVVAHLAPIQQEYTRLLASGDYLDAILQNGIKSAQEKAAPLLAKVKEVVGFYSV
jgi:tryptophanyl-tRNA synthetase